MWDETDAIVTTIDEVQKLILELLKDKDTTYLLGTRVQNPILGKDTTWEINTTTIEIMNRYKGPYGIKPIK